MTRIPSLDDRDAHLLQLLDLDARITLADIGKKLRISKPAAKRRLERLEALGVVRRYVTIINLPAMGYTIHKLHLKFSGLDDTAISMYTAHLKKYPEIGWILTTIGRWDVVLLIYSKNASQFADSYRNLIAPVADRLAKKRVTVIASLTHLPHDFLLKKQPTVRHRVVLADETPWEVDDFDLRLLDRISLDARTTYVKLANTLQVTPKTIRNRIKRLEKENIILGYRAVLDAGLIGYEHHQVSIFLTAATIDAFKKVRGYVESLPETVLFVDSLGDSDIEFDIKVESTARLHAIISALRQRFTDLIRNVDTLLITDEDIIDYTPRL